MIKHLIVGAICCIAGPSIAEPITVEADDGVTFIRCVDAYGNSSCELVFEFNNKFYDCIALDQSGSPLATGVGSGGSVYFEELDNTLIADVKCRRRG